MSSPLQSMELEDKAGGYTERKSDCSDSILPESDKKVVYFLPKRDGRQSKSSSFDKLQRIKHDELQRIKKLKDTLDKDTLDINNSECSNLRRQRKQTLPYGLKSGEQGSPRIEGIDKHFADDDRSKKCCDPVTVSVASVFIDNFAILLSIIVLFLSAQV